jgi:hypothetical protein
MHRQQQDVFVIGQSRQPPADQRPMLKVEWLGGFARGQQIEFGRRVFIVTKVVFMQEKAAFRGSDDLHREPIDPGERGAQGFVPRDDPIERAAQGLAIEVALEP